MSRDEIASFSAVYAEVAGIRDFQGQEFLLESSLAYLSADQRLDDRSRNDALGTLGKLDALNAVNAGLSSLMIEEIEGLHLPVDRAARSAELKQMIGGERRYWGRCVKDVQIQF